MSLPKNDADIPIQDVILWARRMHRRARVKMRHAVTCRLWGMCALDDKWIDLGGEG